MFVARAHSFEQQARLAITLAWVAGYTNIITLMTCGVVTSHVTGTVSNIGHVIADGEWTKASAFAGLLAAFAVGAGLASALTEFGRRRNWNSIYVLPMAVETLLLALLALGLEFRGRGFASDHSLAMIASAAMGLQNAAITRISGGVVRTTHLTGVLTDLGAEAVTFILRAPNVLRQHGAVALIRDREFRRVIMLASILGSFSLGAGLGSIAISNFPALSMFPPVAFLIWIIYQDVSTPICELTPGSTISDEYLPTLPAWLRIFQLRKGVGRERDNHRLPDLERWLDTLPSEAKVVVLDLAGAPIDAEAAIEIREIVNIARQRGVRMLISGLTTSQYHTLRSLGASDVLDADTVCLDIELAIARALANPPESA